MREPDDGWGERVWLGIEDRMGFERDVDVVGQTEEKLRPVKRHGFHPRKKDPLRRHRRRHSHRLHLTVHLHRSLRRHRYWDRPVRP